MLARSKLAKGEVLFCPTARQLGWLCHTEVGSGSWHLVVARGHARARADERGLDAVSDGGGGGVGVGGSGGAAMQGGERGDATGSQCRGRDGACAGSRGGI
jgi:hypothetical protein